jgi:hypothetical protein
MKNDNIFKSVALKNGISEDEVKREIENTIAEACKDPDAPINKIGSGKVPTPEEVMEHVLREIARSKLS